MNGFNISSISTAQASFLVGTKGNSNASIIPTVSPLSVQNGAFHATNFPQIEFQYNDSGGYNHYIISQHDGADANCNSVDFFIYSAGGSQSSSSAPGTGNTQAFSIRGDSVQTFKPLFMNDNYIDLRPVGFSGNGLCWGSVAPYSVGVDGPFLFGYTQGALGTTSNSNDISIAWDTNKIEMYKPIDMNGNGIGDGGGFLTISSITVGVVGSDSVALFAGNNSTFSVLNVTSTNIDLVASTVTRSLAGVSVAQPVIQYGEDGVSGASGSVAITLGTPYTSVSSFVAFASMMDTNPAQIAVNRDSASQITLEWSSAGGGSHRIAWQTLGT
jgi:hypothetical protein